MKQFFLSILISAAFLQGYSQRTCGTMDYHQMMLQQDPNYLLNRQAIENFTSQYVTSNPSGSRSVITIPVVVHVIYNTAVQNISDAQIFSQIDSLNKDFRLLNADKSKIPAAFSSLAADFQIQFCLAQRDPNGNATTGIVRKQTTVTSWTTNDNVKYSSKGGDDAWNRNSYLNLWVCNLGNSLLGYAQFPGGAAATDGVVVLYTAFGSVGAAATGNFNKGRTATHEIGHWLNLYHIWGDDNGACTGSDLVNDTPNQANMNYGCPTYPKTDACQASSPGVMFMNYMDYVNDACMYMFTSGQYARTSALFATGGSRASLATSQGCVPVANQAPIADFSGTPTSVCPGGSVVFTNLSSGNPTSYSWAFQGGTPATSTATNPTVTYSSAGIYSVTLTATNANGSNTKTQTGYITVGGAQSLPLVEGFQSTTFPPANWNIVNPDNATAWLRTTSAGGYGASTASAYFDNYNSNNKGQRDYLNTPAYDFTGVANGRLKFDYAYTYYSNPAGYDSLEIMYSDDCGASWTRLWKKGGTALATTNPISGKFTPTASQWKSDSISLSALSGKSNVRFSFVNINRYGNTLFLDNINIYNSTSTCNKPVADFSANPTTISAGGTVSFTDLSTNNPTSWSWTFTGGSPTSSIAQNPTVTFASTGSYTVTLVATNSCGASTTTTKTNFIQVVNPGASTCDTITNIRSIDSVAVYLFQAPASGYLSGRNSSGDSAFADKYYVASGTQVTGGLFAFGIAKFANANSKIIVRVWDTTGVGGSPGNVLASQTVNISTISSNINANPYQFTSVTFPSPANISGTSFFLGFVIPYTNGDTVAIFTTRLSQSTNHINDGWSSDGTWSTYQSYINYGLSNYIFPLTCTTSSSTPPIASFTANDTTICVGDTVRFTSSSTNTTSWSWTFPGGTPASSNAQNPVVVYNSAGSYNVSLTASNGQTNTLTKNLYIVVSQNPSATTTTIPANCFGGTTGSATVTASGGSSPYSYSWAGGGSSSTLSNKPAGTYAVTVTDNNQCKTTASAIISEPLSALTLATDGTDASCNLTNGDASVIASGGNGGYSYNWSTGDTTTAVNNLGATTYFVTVTDVKNCKATGSYTIAMLPNTSSVSISSSNATCGQANGAAIALPSGSSIGAQYVWSNGSVAGSITGLTPNNYTVTVTNSSGCTATASASISNLNGPDIVVNTTNISCFGLKDGAATVIINTPGSYNIDWSTGSSNTGSISNLIAGNYSVTVSNGSTCQSVQQFSITQAPAITGSSSATNTNSNGQSNGTASVVATGGSGTLSYTWSNSGTTPTISGLSAGQYVCTVEDASGCSVTFVATVGENGVDEISLAGNIVIFPNPAHEAINIEASFATIQTFEIKLLDELGRNLYTSPLISDKNHTSAIKLDGLAKGIYFVNLKSESGQRTFKFIKQ